MLELCPIHHIGPCPFTPLFCRMLNCSCKTSMHLRHYFLTVAIICRSTHDDVFEDTSLDAAFVEDESDMAGDASDSDGYLSEVLRLNYAFS